MILIDGKKAAAELREELKKEVAELKGDKTKINWIRIGMKNNNFYVPTRQKHYRIVRSIFETRLLAKR